MANKNIEYNKAEVQRIHDVLIQTRLVEQKNITTDEFIHATNELTDWIREICSAAFPTHFAKQPSEVPMQDVLIGLDHMRRDLRLHANLDLCRMVRCLSMLDTAVSDIQNRREYLKRIMDPVLEADPNAIAYSGVQLENEIIADGVLFNTHGCHLMHFIQSEYASEITADGLLVNRSQKPNKRKENILNLLAVFDEQEQLLRKTFKLPSSMIVHRYIVPYGAPILSNCRNIQILREESGGASLNAGKTSLNSTQIKAIQTEIQSQGKVDMYLIDTQMIQKLIQSVATGVAVAQTHARMKEQKISIPRRKPIFFSIFYPIFLLTNRPPFKTVKTHEQQDSESGQTIAYLDIDIPYFRSKAYAPLAKAIEEVVYDARIQYNIIRCDALKDAEKDPTVSQEARWVRVESQLKIDDDAYIVDLTVESFDGESTHGYVQAIKFDTLHRYLGIQDISMY